MRAAAHAGLGCCTLFVFLLRELPMLYMILFLLCAGASSIGALVGTGVVGALIGSKISKKIPDRRVEMPCLCLYLA